MIATQAMHSDNESVAVIIPAYNAEHVVSRAIETVLAQTRPPDEVIVVDDGSKDGTAEVVRRFCRKVLYMYQENAGVSAARNSGMRMAKAKWLAFVDADDEWKVQNLEKQLSVLCAHPEIMWSCCGIVRAVEGMPVGGIALDPSWQPKSREGVLDFVSAAIAGVNFQPSGFLINRDVFQTVGCFDTALRVCADRDMWWRIAMEYPKLGYVADPLCYYHIDTPGSLMKETKDRTESLDSLCENALRASKVSAPQASLFLSYARNLAWDYLARRAYGEIKLSTTVVQRTFNQFGYSAMHKSLLYIAGRIPRRTAKAFLAICRQVVGA